MYIDALPKIIFLNEESEQMQDQRIRNKVEYDTSSDIPKRVVTKKINNTIQFTQKLSSNNEINCLAYSNKLGLLISCLQNEILITDFPHLEQYIATLDTSEKSLKKISAALKFAGKIYLTPDEMKFLAVNKDEFMLFDLVAQKIISIGTNEHHLRHFAFVTSESFVAWNFLSHAYFYDKITGSIENPKILEGVQKCTSANIIQNHIAVCQKVNIGEDDQDTKVIVFDSTASNVVNEILLSKFENPDNYFFNFTQIISVFSIKHEKEGLFSQNDVYGLVLGYYDDYQDQPDRRYLNFLKGNLILKDSELKIRGFELFLSPTEDRTFYYFQNGQKIPFQVQILSTGSTKIIMIEKLEIIYVVDSTVQFKNLNLYSLQPSHEIKLQGEKYFKGVCLMKNMFQAQRKSPADSNETCKMICKDFKGQFLGLYFPAKQTELTVPFPASVLVLGDNKIQRRYAIETYQSIEEYETDKIKEAINKIKSSPYIETVQNQVKVDGNKEIDLSIRQLLNQVPQKKEEPRNLFVQKIKAATLFDFKPVTAPSEGLFGQISESKAGTSLFMVKPTQEKKNTSLFDFKPPTSLAGGIFGQTSQPSTGAGLFGAKASEEKKFPSLFDSEPTIFTKYRHIFEPKKELSINLSEHDTQSRLFNSKDWEKPLCIGKKQATHLCLNPKCKLLNQGIKKIPIVENQQTSKKIYNPFICSDDKCQFCSSPDRFQWNQSKNQTKSRRAHQNCFMTGYRRLLFCIKQKNKNCQPLKESINKIFDNFIDYLSDLRQKYLNELKYIGLSSDQQKFLSLFENKQYQFITPELSFQVVNKLPNQTTYDALRAKERLEDYWKEQEEQVKDIFAFMSKKISKEEADRLDAISMDSMVVTFEKEKLDLIKMLQDQQKKTVSEFTLLYRASQNDFDVRKFHQKCDLIEHTVVVIQTEYGKKIGGYTPFAWDGNLYQQWHKDSSGKSFIFSLTNNHKFTLLKSYEQYATYQDSNYGPIFGGGNDICISDKCNINNCQANIGSSYTHPEYKSQKQTAWTKFSGAIGTQNFKAKEWEVFEVKWSQQ